LAAVAIRVTPKPCGPPGTLLGVTTLGYRDQLVEVEAVALISSPSR